MNKIFLSLKQNKRVVIAIKIIICTLLMILLIKNSLTDGIRPYLCSRDYIIQNGFDANSCETVSVKDISQTFVARGNILNKIYFYFSGETTADETFEIKIIDGNSNVLFEDQYYFNDYTPDTYCALDVNVHNLDRNDTYTLQISESGDEAIFYCLSLGSADIKTFGNYFIDGKEYEGCVSLGFQFTYEYMTAGNVLFFVLRMMLIALLGLVFCYGIYRIEDLISVYRGSKKIEGIPYALYFAACVSSFFNPLDKLRTTVITFTREIGAGYIAGYDASRAIKNFSNWFIIFAVSFVIFSLVFNSFIKQERDEEANKVLGFLNNIIVLADVNIVLRAITYFYDESQSDNIFYYSSWLLALLIAFGVGYLFFNLGKIIKADTYYQILLFGYFVSIPITILIRTEWESNKFLIGVQGLVCIFLLGTLLFSSKLVHSLERKGVFRAAVIVSALLPFITSFYIEAVNIANQYGIFISSLRRYYFFVCVIALVFLGVIILLSFRKEWEFAWWKKWTNIWFVVGLGCLSQQIALENIYTPDIYESANSSVLISDFLQFGKIPIVEHLGHHMMQGVWEGLIYAVINNDYSGAIVSPYEGYILVPLMLLFYFFVKIIWNEDVALWTTLLFPFYGNWSDFAWGILLLLAIVSFAEKNNYARSFGIWGALVWCCLCRADIGLSFGIACFIALTIYVITEKNWKSIKQLLLPLFGICIASGVVWCILCMAKDINPITRLVEFIKLFAATINWTREGIGNSENMVFSWSYMLIPFSMIVACLYTVFSKKIRENMGKPTWMALLVLGFAYFANYSRALSRHSLREMAMGIVIWTGYIFLALFFACFRQNRKLFLPAFACLILCNTLFIQDGNFTASPIADSALTRLGSFTEGWTLSRFADEDNPYVVNGEVVTYWKKIKLEQDVKQRVQYSDEFKDTMAPYGYITTALLDDGETFIDFIYDSYVYSEFEKFDPVYAVQSPTMLSGELSQEYFINEIESNIDNIPIAFMPNETGYHSVMDGIRLNYKYYKVAEFIYKNYRPLCNYGNFSVWCLNNRYEEMVRKLQGIDVLDQIHSENAVQYNCTVSKSEEGLTIKSTGNDPYICGLEDIFTNYENMTVGIDIIYKSDTEGELQMYYTISENDSYSDDKMSAVRISHEGTAHFDVPITEYSHLRLDIPEQSQVTITGIKISAFGTSMSRMDSLLSADSYSLYSCDVIKDDDSLSMVSNGVAPRIVDFQEALGLDAYRGRNINVIVKYSTADNGEMQMYYTTENGECFTGDKCVTNYIEGNGTAVFKVEVTDYTRIRLDIPAGSKVTIEDISLALQGEWNLVDWGYDKNQHQYSINRLPLYWAELDEQKASDNLLISGTKNVMDMDNIFVIDKPIDTNGDCGNYALLSATYLGADMSGMIEQDDEYIPATLVLGECIDGNFVERCRYNFTIQEGSHDYIFRVSSDYYWMLGNVNAIQLECSEELSGIEVNILQGD